MHLYSLGKASELLGKNKTWLDNKVRKSKENFAFLHIDENGKKSVNIEHKDFIKLQKLLLENPTALEPIRASKEKKEPKKEKKLDDATREISDLLGKARIADLHKKIAISTTEQEKAKQAIIETLRVKKDLVPISLLKHFFSFGDNIIQNLYRRPHEIIIQMAVLILNAKDQNYKEAEKYLIREIETIIKAEHKRLLEEVELEGFEFEK